MQTLIPGSGAISELLAMIERRAPVLMRCGGCANGSGLNTENGGSPITRQMKRRFAQYLREGKSMEEVAELTGVHYQTVARHTREVRAEIGYSTPRRKTA